MNVCEHFYSLQGEGANSGKPAYFLRLSGCNVRCSFCDSMNSWNENSGEKMSELEIADAVQKSNAENVVITGGEPLLHNLDALCKTLRTRIPKVKIWIETSGTAQFSGNFDWVCLSPKQHCLPFPENYTKANELKIIIAEPADFDFAENEAQKVNTDCDLFLQAEWSKQKVLTETICNFIQKHPKWRLSVQVHKFLGFR